MSKSWIPKEDFWKNCFYLPPLIKLKARKNWVRGEETSKRHYTENFCCWDLQWPPYWGHGSARGPLPPCPGETHPCRGTICLMLYDWSCQMKGKPSLKREAGGSGQFRIQHKDKIDNLLFSSPPDTVPWSWVIDRIGRLGHLRRSRGYLAAMERSVSLSTEHPTWQLRFWLSQPNHPGVQCSFLPTQHCAWRRDQELATPGCHHPGRTETLPLPETGELMTLKVEELRLWYFHIVP